MPRNLPVLDYAQPRAGNHLAPLGWFAGVPGAFGILFIYPHLAGRVSRFTGPEGTVCCWLLAAALAVATLTIAARHSRQWYRWPGMLIDAAWLAITVFPPGGPVLLFMIMHVLGLGLKSFAD